MKEVLGQNGLNAVLNTARLSQYVNSYPPADFSPGMTFEETGRLFEAIEGMFGQRAGRRLARQSGRICFQFGIEGFGAVIGFMDFVLRILPMSLRARIGLEVLSEILNRYSDQRVVLEGDDENYYFKVVPCGICWGRYASEPLCSLLVGIVEEILYWVSRGRHFNVEEIACVAQGDASCTLRVHKTPVR
ncbi:MAG: hypothetical protein ACLFTI_02215 [Anaerolineales bacterium]